MRKAVAPMVEQRCGFAHGGGQGTMGPVNAGGIARRSPPGLVEVAQDRGIDPVEEQVECALHGRAR
ncbi:hypothetical protein GCM10009626_32930 [Brachybacterium sacelli]